MKPGAAAHENIFLISCLILAAALIATASLARRDEALHISNYGLYEEANAKFEENDFGGSYDIYDRLANIYPGSYILELKMAVCAINMDMWAEAVEHSRKSLELRPLLAKDEDFMHGLSYCLKKIGEEEAASRVEEYFYGFASLQNQGL
jgi:tetratricopeptide (TPR) repeat protein